MLKRLLSLALLLPAIFIAGGVGLSPFGAWFDAQTYRLTAYQTPDETSEQSPVLLVDLDAESLKQFGQWPISRGVHAEVINRLTALGATAVVYNLAFITPDHSPDSADPQLLAALKNNGRVVLPFVAEEQVDKSTASEKPQIFAEHPAEPPVISPPVMTVKAEKTETVTTTTTVSADQVKAAPPQEESGVVTNPKLLADLTATVEKARQKKQGSVTVEAPKPDATSDKLEPIKSAETVASVTVSQGQKVTAKTDVEPSAPQERPGVVLAQSDPEPVIAEVVAELSETEKLSQQKSVPQPAVAIAPLRVVKATPELQLPVKPPIQSKPVVKTAQPIAKKSVAGINNEKAVRAVVNGWSSAWAAQDWDAYINSYLQHTQLYGVKMSVEEWRAFRKKRLLTPAWIKLKLGEAKYTRLNSHWYRVEFYQRFEKPGYADETTKILELTLTSSGWKIASEATDGTVVLKRPLG
jgi:hypothetical protein